MLNETRTVEEYIFPQGKDSMHMLFYDVIKYSQKKRKQNVTLELNALLFLFCYFTLKRSNI